MIDALSQYPMPNVFTLPAEFEHDLSQPDWRAGRRADARLMLAAYLTSR
jgi:hypothetical protein